MTPQEAVDLVTTAEQFHRDFAGVDHLVVWWLNWKVEIYKEDGTGHGVAYRWPLNQTEAEAFEGGEMEWCELGVLECSRIVNFLAREVKRRGK